ncbi:MAG: DUF1611 domain-containing protein [Bacteroidetes bacterium]|nr:DUF1611 domain-containing protein [Bacteroidota bacterium]
MEKRALILANGLFDSVFAKTTHGLIRGPSRYEILGVIDPEHAGQDAGAVLDGYERGIRFYRSMTDALQHLSATPTHCVVGVATVGGVLPSALKEDLFVAASAGLTLVNGLHQLLSDDAELAKVAKGGIIDLRKPRPASELRFWTGEILSVPTPRIAVLGMDCAIGKRTTAMLMQKSFLEQGIATEVIYTGQTGWLQGMKYGFIFDATLNDFVSGELERAIVQCYQETKPDVILLEGQSALRNPAGPAGSEFICSAQASGVIFQHAPARIHFEDFEHLDCMLPPLAEEIELIRLLGSEVWGVSLFTRGLGPAQAAKIATELEAKHQIPVIRSLEDGVGRLVTTIRERLNL